MRIRSIESTPFHIETFTASASVASASGELAFFRGVVDELPAALDAIVLAADLQGVVHHENGTIGLGDALPAVVERLRGSGTLPSRERTATILAGDLYPNADEGNVTPIWVGIGEVCRWVVGVLGNHDRLAGAALGWKSMEVGANGYCLDGGWVALDQLRIGGIAGVIGRGALARSEREYAQALSSLVAERCDLLVLHDGPNVEGTDLPGWPVARRILEAAAPTLVIRGHDHWRDPLAELVNGTQVLNVEGRVIVLQRSPGSTSA